MPQQRPCGPSIWLVDHSWITQATNYAHRPSYPWPAANIQSLFCRRASRTSWSPRYACQKSFLTKLTMLLCDENIKPNPKPFESCGHEWKQNYQPHNLTMPLFPMQLNCLSIYVTSPQRKQNYHTSSATRTLKHASIKTMLQTKTTKLAGKTCQPKYNLPIKQTSKHKHMKRNAAANIPTKTQQTTTT